MTSDFFKSVKVLGGLLCCLVVMAYANTFQAAWQLDDYSKIIDNPRLHLTDLSAPAILQAIHDKGGNLYRPVACLTLALNWYGAKDQVIGYHIVNLTIHLLTAGGLFFTILLLFKTPRLAPCYRLQSAYVIAFLATLWWALHPIQTQAVTYIVQRMASLAAMFYVLGMYLFLRAKMAENRRRRIIWGLMCCLSYVLAIGSKQNAVVFPLALVLVEVIFFQTITGPALLKKTGRFIWPAGLMALAGLAALLYLTQSDVWSIFSFKHRSFTLLERLLTQFRVVVFYLTQLVYPIPQRLSIDHPIMVSSNCWQPWVTWPAMVAVFSMLTAGVLAIKKHPLLALGVLFYFLNHLVESTILPLELVFEHRNYLPSMFLFLPLVAILKNWYDDQVQQSRWLALTVKILVVLLMLTLALGTYTRNMVWQTERRLWLDAAQKAPQSARSVYNLARTCPATPDGMQTALVLLERAIHLGGARPGFSQAMAWNGMAGIHYARHDYAAAVRYGQKALARDPARNDVRYNLARSLVKSKRLVAAGRQLDILLENHPQRVDYLWLKAWVLLRGSQPQQALPYLRRAIKQAPGQARIRWNMAKAFSLGQDFENAHRYWRQGVDLAPDDITGRLGMLENCLRAGNTAEAREVWQQLVNRFSVVAIWDRIKMLQGEKPTLAIAVVPVDIDIIRPAISAYLNQAAEKLVAGVEADG